MDNHYSVQEIESYWFGNLRSDFTPTLYKDIRYWQNPIGDKAEKEIPKTLFYVNRYPDPVGSSRGFRIGGLFDNKKDAEIYCEGLNENEKQN